MSARIKVAPAFFLWTSMLCNTFLRRLCRDVEATAPPLQVVQRLLRVNLQYRQTAFAEDDSEKQRRPFDVAVKDAVHEGVVDQAKAPDQALVSFLALLVAVHLCLGLYFVFMGVWLLVYRFQRGWYSDRDVPEFG